MNPVEDTPSSKPEDKAFFQWISQHLLNITVTYRTKVGEEKWLTFSGCVVSYRGSWFLLTAGHAVAAVKKGIEPGATITASVISDYYGIAARHQNAIPFNILEAPSRVVDDDNGLDFALLPLSGIYRRMLKANNIIDLPMEVPTRPDDKAFQSYIVIGFPEELQKIVFDPKGVAEETRPYGLKLDREPDDMSKGRSRFVGRIKELGELKSTVGFSGGPILGFVPQTATSTDVHLIATQMSWDKKDRIFGCYIDEIFRYSKEWLDAVCDSNPDA